LADLLNLGSTALLSLQRAISTTGHNISNANTEGFSRQRVDFVTQPPQFAGGNFIGNGVSVASIERQFDAFVANEVRERTASQAQAQTFFGLTSRVDNLLADPRTGLGSAMDRFFGALQDVANNPASLPERQALLGEAGVLADRFHFLDASLRDLDAELNGRIEVAVAGINSLTTSIASLNEQIARATAQAQGSPPNDLLDERDRLVNELAQSINVSVVSQDSGAVTVMAGNGQPLVVGNTSTALQTAASVSDPTRLVVGVGNPGGSFTDLGRFLSGGELGGLLDFRAQVLDPARAQLGLLAVGITETVNGQHALGLDLDGLAGGDLFRPLSAATSAHAGNAGAAAVDVSIVDAGALTGDEYLLRFDGAQYVLTNLGSGVTQSGPGPFVVDGLNIAISGAAASGDAFSILPTRQAGALFDVALTDPRRIAAAGPLRAEPAPGNSGTASISQPAVQDAAGLPLGTPVTLTFDPDALGPGQPGFDVAGASFGPLAYDPALDQGGLEVDAGGFRFTLAGRPDAGDVLQITDNSGAAGDNRNALALAELQTARTLLGGSATYQDSYGSLVTDVGVQTRQADANSRTETALLEGAVARREGVSGVNLDEEAANLIRFQQAFQAAAQVIAVADEVFQTLLDATRR